MCKLKTNVHKSHIDHVRNAPVDFALRPLVSVYDSYQPTQTRNIEQKC